MGNVPRSDCGSRATRDAEEEALIGAFRANAVGWIKLSRDGDVEASTPEGARGAKLLRRVY